MNVLIIGSGGREHALAWKIKQSPLCEKLFVAPGNAGTDLCGENVEIDPSGFDDVGDFAIENNIDMVVVGPEAPLVNGIADFFSNDSRLKHISVIGPVSAGAKLEGSKDFAKAFMQKYQIPTAGYKSFTIETVNEGILFLETLDPPYVLKADGLAAGKGVLICDTLEEAKSYFKKMLSDRMFGDASDCVVVEEFLKGYELSVFVAVDGNDYVLLPEAKDYKPIGEGNTGPNTGGMGCVSPVKFADKEFMEKVRERIIEPTIYGLKEEKITYKGFLFFGLMNVKGDPYVIEYNVRLGDPEAEVILPRINTDFTELLKSLGDGTLSSYRMEISAEAAATFVLASGGYPGSYAKGYNIKGLDSVKDSIVFLAGVKQQKDVFKTSGGRVLAVTALGKNLKAALKKAKLDAEKIKFKDKYYRKDIGQDVA